MAIKLIVGLDDNYASCAEEVCELRNCAAVSIFSLKMVDLERKEGKLTNTATSKNILLMGG